MPFAGGAYNLFRAMNNTEVIQQLIANALSAENGRLNATEQKKLKQDLKAMSQYMQSALWEDSLDSRYKYKVKEITQALHTEAHFAIWEDARVSLLYIKRNLSRSLAARACPVKLQTVVQAKKL